MDYSVWSFISFIFQQFFLFRVSRMGRPELKERRQWDVRSVSQTRTDQGENQCFSAYFLTIAAERYPSCSLSEKPASSNWAVVANFLIKKNTAMKLWSVAQQFHIWNVHQEGLCREGMHDRLRPRRLSAPLLRQWELILTIQSDHAEPFVPSVSLHRITFCCFWFMSIKWCAFIYTGHN